MSIRTFSEQYREEGIEPRKKLKRVRSVKVANLDRLRLSMRREKSRFNRSAVASIDDVIETSESSSTGISGTSSPNLANYMKDTTSSSARKGPLQASSGNIQSSSASSSDTRTTERQDNSASSAKSASKSSKVPVQEWSDPAGVNIPVIVKPEKSLKRVPSLKHSKKLTSKKSMKIRAKYSQFQDVSISQDEMLSFGEMEFWGDSEINGGRMEIDPERPSNCSSHGQGSMVKTGVQQRGILQRSRSRKLTRTRSIRSSKARQRQQYRFSSGATELMSHEAEVSNAEPHYMRGTSSQELKKNSDKGLTRTSSLRPLRILAKIPSLRSKRSKAKKRPQATSMSGTSVDRATCSSVLKRAELSDGIELHPKSRESEGATSLHVCPYSYCSIHGQRHHSPSQSVKEIVSAKRKLISNKKGEKTESQSGGEVEHHLTKATESEYLRQMVSAENNPVQEVLNATTESVTEAEDDGMDFLIKIYAKPRKKWATEATQNEDAGALDSCTYDQIRVGDYEGKLVETLSETSGSEETQGALNGDQQEIYERLKQNHNSNIAALSLPSDKLHLASRDSVANSSGDLINIFSDKKKYTNMWQLIHQQLLSSEASLNEAKDVTQANEKEGEDGNTHLEISNLDPEQSEYNNHLSDDVDDQIAVTEKLELHQDAAMKLVQEAVNAILQRDAGFHEQQSIPVQEMAKSFVREHVSTPTASQEETFREGGKIEGKEMTLASSETKHDMEQTGKSLLQKEPNAHEMSGRQMSKSLSKLKRIFVTAKFIKAMERLKKINPHKTQYLSAKAASETERVNLRHLGMNGEKNTEEWMLDNALRQVISRLDPDQQRRVAQLVEAFETIAPEQEEKSKKRHPMKRVLAPGDKLPTPVIGEKKLFVEHEQDTSLYDEQVVKLQDGVLESHKGDPQEQYFTQEDECPEITTGGKILEESNETNMPDSTLILAETSKSVYVDSEFDDGRRGDEEPKNTLKAPPNKNSEVDVAGDTTTIFFNKKKYRSMWHMIYKHVVTSEAGSTENQRVNKFDEEHDDDDGKNIRQEMDDRGSISSDYSMEQNEDANDQSGEVEKLELDQSAAIKLVKEALGAILNSYEQQTHLQSIPEPSKVSNDARDLYIPTPTSSTEENSIEESKVEEKHTYSDVEDKLHQVENISLPLQQQVECGEMKPPQRKMSKSLSKLKKAIATARFIKAMERLTKSSPRKSQNLSSITTSEEERVYLRHRSMDGRKTGEEWMLDFALRQVISKMAPDQQRRVERLVEAFETMHPEHTERGIPSHPSKGEAADKSELAKNCYLKSQQHRSISVEQVPQKQIDGTLPPTRDVFLHRSLEEDRDQQLNSSETNSRNASLERNVQETYHQQTSITVTGDIMHETNETAKSESAIDLAKNGLKSPSVAVKPEEPSTGDGESRRATEFPSLIPTVKVRQDGNMATILLNKQKYTSMWHLIHQHVLSNEASTVGKQEVDEVNEDKQGDGANKSQATNDPESTESSHLKNFKVDEENQSATFDQSAALNLVKDAISAILQCHEHGSDQQSLKEHGGSADNTREICDTNALAFTKENYGGNRMVKQIDPEPEEKLQEVNFTDAPLQQQAEAKTSQRKMSTGISKLKKAIATAKFIKAMERLRKINPRKIRHLPAETTSEEERVHLRHLSINKRSNGEEWMLDYALRKVLSNLSPEEQSKVALIVEAFETVNPRLKGISSVKKSDWDPAIETESTAHKKQFLQFKHDSSKSNDEDIPPMHNDRLNSLNMLGKVKKLENSKQEDNSIEFSNHKAEKSSKIVEPDDSSYHIQHQTRSKGSPNSNQLTEKKEEIDANPRHEPLQQAKDFRQDTETNIAKDIYCEKQKNTSMWHLIYQQVDSISAAEARSKHSERQTIEDPMSTGGASSEMIADADSDDSDASSVTGELNESDATKLVREAINNILNTPEDLENDTASSNETTASEEGQKTSAEEKPTKSLSKAYSKLRKLIICNKFIQAMEKTKRSNPQEQISPAFKSDSEAGKAHLKNRALGEKKGMDEWMLDNVLQKVIAELAPVQQRKVSMLVEAFEKVPDPQKRGKRHSSSTTKFLKTNSSKENSEENEDIKSSMNAKCPDDSGLKLNESTTSSREKLTERIPRETCKDKTSGLSKEYTLDGENQSSGPCYTATTSDAIRILSDTCKDPTDFDGADAPHDQLKEKTDLRNEVGVQSEGTSTEEQLTSNTEQTSTAPQPDDLKNEWNYGAHKARSSEKSTNLWGLILQKVTTDMLEKDEAPNTVEIDENAKRDSDQMLETRTDDTSQASSKAKSCRDMSVQTPTSFEFQEDEAIKLVEEAVEEILLIQDQMSDTESMTSSTTSEQEIYSPKHEDASEPSLAATETMNMAASPHAVATSEEEKSSSKEILPKSYSALSKVILCKRFVKAMDKMRKLKAQSTQNTSQPPHSEEKGIPSLRQTLTGDKTGWDEGMLDNALQKVIGNLAPAKKKRVALLVQAFETVGSQPESTKNSSRGKASVS